jgi:hypothetical protein
MVDPWQLWRPADEPEYFECQPLVESKGTTDTHDEEVRLYRHKYI